jgi:hypothetical protein
LTGEVLETMVGMPEQERLSRFQHIVDSGFCSAESGILDESSAAKLDSTESAWGASSQLAVAEKSDPSSTGSNQNLVGDGQQQQAGNGLPPATLASSHETVATMPSQDQETSDPTSEMVWDKDACWHHSPGFEQEFNDASYWHSFDQGPDLASR